LSQDLLQYFQILKKQNTLGTSYLFIGQDASLVNDIIKLISCPQEAGPCSSCWDCKRIDDRKHPDIFTIAPDGFSIKISSIREGIRFFSLKGYRLAKKIMIIKDAQALTPAAANAFLKTLEEPPKNSLIIILTSKLEGILPTIISRCRKIFLPFSVQDAAADIDQDVIEFLRGQDIRFSNREKFLLGAV